MSYYKCWFSLVFCKQKVDTIEEFNADSKS